MNKNELEIRASIRELQAKMLAAPEEIKLKLEPEHSFIDGFYLRKLILPPGAVVVGGTHKKDHILVIGKGRCTMINEQGVHEIKGPKMFLSKRGTKRAFKAWQLGCDIVTIHPNPSNTRDVEKLEKELIEENL